MTKRPRIAEDFFDATFPDPQSTPKPSTTAPEAPQAEPAPMAAAGVVGPPAQATPSKGVRSPRQPKQAQTAPSQDGSGKVRTTLYIREELHEKARWAILNLEKAPRSISQLIEGALERELERLGKVNRTEIERHRMALPGGRPRATA